MFVGADGNALNGNLKSYSLLRERACPRVQPVTNRAVMAMHCFALWHDCKPVMKARCNATRSYLHLMQASVHFSIPRSHGFHMQQIKYFNVITFTVTSHLNWRPLEIHTTSIFEVTLIKIVLASTVCPSWRHHGCYLHWRTPWSRRRRTPWWPLHLQLAERCGTRCAGVCQIESSSSASWWRMSWWCRSPRCNRFRTETDRRWGGSATPRDQWRSGAPGVKKNK